jgi:hypothetical protein
VLAGQRLAILRTITRIGRRCNLWLLLAQDGAVVQDRGPPRLARPRAKTLGLYKNGVPPRRQVELETPGTKKKLKTTFFFSSWKSGPKPSTVFKMANYYKGHTFEELYNVS